MEEQENCVTTAMAVAMTIIVCKVMTMMIKYTFTNLCHALNSSVTSKIVHYIYFNEQHEIAEKIFLSSLRKIASSNQTF